MSTPRLELPLGIVTVRVWRPDYLETVWPDGRVCPALFVDDAQARAHAAEWGYGDDVQRMHLEHELTHTLLAQANGLPWSPVLYHVAGGPHVPTPTRAEEEGRVVAVQRISNQLAAIVQRYREAVGR